MQPVIEYFSLKYNKQLSAQQKELIAGLFKREEFKKKTPIFLNGELNTKHYFIVEGLVRMYIIDSTGKEFNILFAHENQVLGDLGSPNPTVFNLETIENSIVYSITNENLERLREEVSDEFALDSNSRLKKSYIFLQQRLVSILSKTAEENYLDLRDNFPELLQRLPQYHIASYLGVSAEFLSKIIARTTKK